MTAFDKTVALRIIEQHRGLEGPLLPILHGLQGAFGYIPPEAQPLVAEALNLSRAEVHGVVSFYHDFRTEKPAALVVRLCRAEACQAADGAQAAAALLDALHLTWGETATDRSVVVEPVYCLGLCAAAPAGFIGETPMVRLDGKRLCTAVEAAR